jgi:hypothetical protein
VTAAAEERTLDAVAAELAQASNELRLLDEQRLRQAQFGADVRLELGASRLREQVAELQEEFDGLRRAADERLEAERRAAAEALAALQAELEPKQAELVERREAALLAVEQATGTLVEAVQAALAVDGELAEVARQLKVDAPGRTKDVVGRRVSWLLSCAFGPFSVFERPLGQECREPLAEPTAAAKPRAKG